MSTTLGEEASPCDDTRKVWPHINVEIGAGSQQVDTVKVMGYNLIVKDLTIVPMDHRVVINTMSPNSHGLAIKDKETYEALKSSDYLVLDGVYFGLAPILLRGVKVRRITGWDCFVYFCRRLNETNGRCFFLGSTEETLNRIVNRLRVDFPNITASGFAPPFEESFTLAEDAQMRTAVDAFKPDVLFIGMTAPKQEKWAARNHSQLNVHVIASIGNVFDWYAGNSSRPSRLWQTIGLEWLIRIFYRPAILKRNLLNQLAFLKDLLFVILKVKEEQ